MSTTTTNFALIKPAVNSAVDQDLWGGELNTDLDTIDSIVYTAQRFVTRAVSTTASTTTADNHKLIKCDATSAAFTVTLLAAATAGDGFTLAVKKTDSSSNAITIDGNASETIDGATTYTLADQYDSVILVCDGSNWNVVAVNGIPNIPAQTYPKGAIYGLTLSDFTNTQFKVNTGEASDTTGVYNLVLGSALTKTSSAFSAGSGAGGRFGGAIAPSTTYYVFVIRKTSDGTIDAGFDTSLTAANIPSGYVAYRRVGWVKTDASSHFSSLTQIEQAGGSVLSYLAAQSQDITTSSLSTSRTSFTLASCPTGIKMQALIRFGTVSGNTIIVTSLDEADVAPASIASTTPGYDINNQAGDTVINQVYVTTNTSAQIGARAEAASTTFYGYVRGYVDWRR